MANSLMDGALRWLERALFALLSMMVVIVFINVVARFVFDSAITWVDEIARFLFIWLTFIGATVGMARGAHIGMDIVTQAVGPVARRRIAVVSNALILVFLACWGTFGWSLVAQNLDYLAPATGVPMGYVYVIAPVSALAMAILTLVSLVQDLRNASPAQEN